MAIAGDRQYRARGLRVAARGSAPLTAECKGQRSAGIDARCSHVIAKRKTFTSEISTMNKGCIFYDCCHKRRPTICMSAAEAMNAKVGAAPAAHSDPELQRRAIKAVRRRSLPELLALLSRPQGVDVEHRHDPDQFTLLMLASSIPGLHEFVAALLAAGADPNARDSVGRTALHYAAFQSHEEAIRLLLADKRTDVRVVDSEGSTALHYTASPSWTILDRESHLRSIALLMDHPHFEINRPDAIGQTAITTAVLLHYDERVQVMLEHGRERLNVDSSRVSNGGSVREVIERRFPQLAHRLPPRRLESAAAPDAHLRLLATLQHQDLPAFQALLRFSGSDPDHWYDDPYYSTLLELACRQRGAERFVRALLEAGADPNTCNRIYGIPALHQATEAANHGALRVLLREGRARLDLTDRSGHTALHVAAQRQCDSQEEVEDMEKCISLLLSPEQEIPWQEHDIEHATFQKHATLQKGIDIDAQDEFGDTALHDAAHYGNQQVVLTLLRRGANIMKKNIDGDPPLAFVDAATLGQFLDEQIQSNGISPLSQDYQVIIRYTFLEPSSDKGTCSSEMNALFYISRSHDLRPLLRHPVINSFLNMKWYMVRCLFYFNLTMYLIFVMLITAYILLINENDEFSSNCTTSNNNKSIVDLMAHGKSSIMLNVECKENDVNCTHNYMHQVNIADLGALGAETLLKAIFGNKRRCVEVRDDPDNESIQEFAAKCLRIPCTHLLIGMILREIVQCITGWKRYITNWENLLEAFTIIFSATALCSDWDGSSFKQHLSAIVILLTWTELIFMTGRLPILSVQLEMLKKVSFTFMRFMAWYSILVVAFALSFYTLFRRSSDFESDSREPFFVNPGLSIIKTIIMMVGEFESSNLVFNSVPGTSHVIFVIFVFIISIILLNLLNGLAVYDTQAIKESAVVLGLVSMVNLVDYLETILVQIAEGTHCIYKGVYKAFLEPRIRLFRTELQNKQIHAFPNTGEVKFLLDAATTQRFKGYRMESDVLSKATEILIETKQSSELDQVKDSLLTSLEKFREIEITQAKTESLLLDVLDRLSKIQNVLDAPT